MEITDITYTAKLTSSFCMTHRISVSTVYNADCLLDTEDGMNLISSSMIFSSWTTRIKHEILPQLRTATKQPLLLDGLTFFHLRLGELSTFILFGVALHFALNIFLGTSIIDRFILKIFSLERKVIP